MDTPELPEYIVPLSVLSYAFALSDKRRINQLVQDGVIDRLTRGRYDLLKCTHNYCNYLRSRGGLEQNGDEDDPRVATTRLKNAQAVKYELENAQTQSELLEQTLVLQYLEELAVTLANQYDAFEGRLTRELASVTGADEKIIATTLNQEINAARSDTANAIRTLGDQWAIIDTHHTPTA